MGTRLHEHGALLHSRWDVIPHHSRIETYAKPRQNKLPVMLAKWPRNYYNDVTHSLMAIYLVMAKKIERQSMRSQHGQGLSALWLCFVMFVFGYLAASWFDVNQLVNWVSTHLKTAPAADNSRNKPIEDNITSETHPKLEFYTLLANEQVARTSAVKTEETASVDIQYKAVPEKVSKSSASSEPMELAMTVPEPVQIPVPKPVPPIPKPLPTPTAENVKPQGQYLIQVGSFRALTEAQRMKAKLLSKGFTADIVAVNQQSMYWYRVMLGPFLSLTQAQQAQLAVARQEHITGMIRKLNG